jgi:SAM-dependent methyltransferase
MVWSGRRRARSHASAAPPGEWDGELRDAERLVDSLLPKHGLVRVVEAAAGDGRFAVRAPTYTVGLRVLQAERPQRADLDERRDADLEHLELEQGEYHVAVLHNVLEHVDQPLAVVSVMHRALATNGILVVVSPNVVSLKGLVTRATPKVIRRWALQHLLNVASPEPVRYVHSFSLRPQKLLAHARATGWTVEHLCIYEGWIQKSFRCRIGLLGPPWRLICALTRFLTLGVVTAEGSGLIAVFRKLEGVESLAIRRPDRHDPNNFKT